MGLVAIRRWSALSDPAGRSGPTLGFGRRSRTLVTCVALCLTGPGPSASAPGAVPAAWPEALYNPRPLADDLILPLPCGGGLAFRPVATPADNPRTQLIGPFAGALGRYLLIGKYEVTGLQYQTVQAQTAGQSCPALPGPPATTQANQQVVAQTGVSRIDAVNFAAQLSRWLQANAGSIPACDQGARPCLPRVDGRPAFVRLPLELEWEYAARGGSLVSAETYAQRRYPMPEGLERHAWFNRNADGEIAPIGRRLPNPLGLHDIYGNAWEVMNDPYSSAQFPGQVGGDCLRGGGIHSNDDELWADVRVEVQPYDTAGDVKTADTGFRVVLAVPVVTVAARRPTASTAPAAASAPALATAPATPQPAVPPVSRSASAPAPVADGRVRIAVDTSAIIMVDGEVKGAAGEGRPLVLAGLPRGKHHIEAQAANHQGAEMQVDLASARVAEVSLHLEPTPERSETLLALKPDQRQRIRAKLNQLGFSIDPADNRFDQGFRQALRLFQHQARLPVTGYLNAATLTLLERRAAVARPLPAPPTSPPSPTAGPAARASATPVRPGGRYLQFPDSEPAERWMDPILP